MLPFQHRPAFYKYARKLEISLNANFAKSIACTDPQYHRHNEIHSPFDFHWLHVARFEHLTTLKIWITARNAKYRIDSHQLLRRIPLLGDLTMDALRNALKVMACVDSVVLSTPLRDYITTVDGAEDGPVDLNLPLNIRIWKRGAGDKYHPWLGPIQPDSAADGMLIISPKRYCAWPSFPSCIGSRGSNLADS